MVALLSLVFVAIVSMFFTFEGGVQALTLGDNSLSTADASFWGEDAGDWSGYSVAPAGDVNGDGFDDFLIGACWNDDGGSNAGQTYLILGKAEGWAVDTELSTADASFWGEGADDWSGYSVAAAGDVNGDGFDDFLIGACYDDDGGSNAGQTYLILGKDAGWAMDTSLSDTDASFWGEEAEDWSGYSVAPAGDVNGDGYDDFLIGAHGNDDGGSNAGQTYLILGKAEDWAMDTSLSNADASFWGEEADDWSGYSVAAAGDVNGDDFDDFLIGAYHAADDESNAGQTYLILGKAEGWAMDTSLSEANASFWGENAEDHSGRSVAAAGDVDGDGYDDFLIGAYGADDGGSNAGQTYLILGKTEGWAMDTSLSAVDASFWGENVGDWSSYSVAAAGDVDSDGYDDFLIGAFFNDDGGSNAGQTYLIPGKAEGWAMDTSFSGTDASFWGEDANDWSGYSVAPAGDVNGDGYDDFLVGAYHSAEGETDAGQTYLLLGNALPKAPSSPQCEGETNPIGISNDTSPEFGWTFFVIDSGDAQSAYQILVASSSASLAADDGDMWDSGKVASSASSVSYDANEGLPLSWGETYHWKVKTWDSHNIDGPYCSEQTFTMMVLPNTPISPQCEGETNPTEVSNETPEFGWTFSDTDSEDTQSAYQILVASNSASLAAGYGDMWDSDKVTSSASSASYAGSTLSWGETYYWKVKTWDNGDSEGPYCSKQTFTMMVLPNTPLSPQCEGETNPTEVSNVTPEFGWTFSGVDTEDMQSAYQILVASSSASLAAGNGDIWDSGKVISPASSASYAGLNLSWGETYYWKVKTWDNHDIDGPYCSEQTFTLVVLPNTPVSPQCEGETNPTEVSNEAPEFGWTFSDTDSEDIQSAYQILVASSSASLTADNGDMWDSGKVTSSASSASYAGSTLSWGETYHWKVKTWDNHDIDGPYCPEQTFTMNAAPSQGGLSVVAIAGIILVLCSVLAAIIFVVWNWRRRH